MSDDPLMPLGFDETFNPEVADLIGLKVVGAEHVTDGPSDADEKVKLTFDNGWQLEVATSEWLSVKITLEQAGSKGTAKQGGVAT